MVKALLALTSYNGGFYADGANTGVFFVEASHPYEFFEKNGVDVTIVSETGTFGWDEHSLSADFLQGDDRKVYEDSESSFMKAVKNVKKASEVNPADYDIFFAAGGHGALFDFPKATDLQSLYLAIWEKNGVVAAVCHGPCIFENARGSDGEYFLKGKKATGFTDEGEVMMQLDQIMSNLKLKTPKAGLESCGATYVQPSDPWSSFTVTDGKFVTGVNPASAVETAQKALDAVSA
ncbi:class I glutamine amidotransferase-like protein [Metschnikowia bicuspidata var. bicuspidata NRRL YB-4993]|uniref:D-lactate dehydratase n=1 Tax=Metschnikowia bicuspidata var. bicuspidata NRRL YB-4993 TaxID=869754 RepID=A0A1A0HJH2_9ASCO|nr:class I glutamine amidotransferase-like protein [Metschnikowia bicuspidata var. bicuspidata NRRL YB-4993]OBA24309.1 class I glutamine amidotransferase-like protein [Metschnikowia bicuspidata var. bicuspidata NRRL YB-4993]